jgi:uncharacterized repeat protein (TIGR03803 family)
MQNPAYCQPLPIDVRFQCSPQRLTPRAAPAKEIVMRPSRTSALLALYLLGFVLSGRGQSVTIIHQFPNAGINNPYGPPVQGRDGELYSEVYFSGWGTVFKEEIGGRASPLYVFSQTDGGGGTPESPVLLAGDGNWYGTTADNIFHYGVLYRITPKGVFTQLYNFQGFQSGVPAGSLIEVDGKLYGITAGYKQDAAVYTYDASRSLKVIYQFTTSQFTGAGAALVQGADGNLYGGGTGSDGCGAVFKMTIFGQLLNIWSFDCSLNIGKVNAPLVEGNDGNFYGTALAGYGSGAVFTVSPQGVVSVLHKFGSTPTDGLTGIVLTMGTDGNLYGTTPSGGTHLAGTIYQISGTTYLQLYSFLYAGPQDPSGLIQHTDGKFFGFLEFTGHGGEGGFYSLDMGLGPFISFSSPEGTHPGKTVQILGQGLTGSTSVTFNGVPAASFKVVTDTYMTAVIPSGATTGKVVVTTPGGTLTSNVNFRVIH